ncbi:hypothetical protein LCGC14_0770930 [marine sediment metagenome]|uniref:Uncharacterized protein n=1 Tax=marine sediment metagenome TaxID=412755 RepID=A0A0F9PYF7_9ZZZZ
MKKLLTLFLLLFTLNSFSQPIGDHTQETLTYDLSLGNTTLTTKNLLGFSRLSFELITTSLDAADAVIQIQKTNNDNQYLDIVGATLTFNSGTNTNFIEVENAKNARYKAVLTVNSVTSGTIRIDIAATR